MAKAKPTKTKIEPKTKRTAKKASTDETGELGTLNRVIDKLNSSAWAIYPP